MTAMKGQISGDPFDLPVPHALLRPVQKTSPSGPWLFPRAAAYGDDVLVQTAGGDRYTGSLQDALRLLHDLNLTQQAATFRRVFQLINPLTPLQVGGGFSALQEKPTCCSHGLHLLLWVMPGA